MECQKGFQRCPTGTEFYQVGANKMLDSLDGGNVAYNQGRSNILKFEI